MIQPWRRKNQEIIFENTYAKLDKVIFEMPDGSETDYYIHGKPAPIASVFAITKDEKIILAREYRPGPDKVLDELPGGIMNKGEKPLEGARRELLEETGYDGEFQYLGKSFISAYSPKIKHCFLVTGCVIVAEHSHDEREFIEVVLKTKEEFLQQIKEGDLTDMETAQWALRTLGW